MEKAKITFSDLASDPPVMIHEHTRLRRYFMSEEPRKVYLTQDEQELIADTLSKESIDTSRGTDSLSNINNPSWYNTGKIKVIDFIEDQKLGFHLGNVIKYVCRDTKAIDKVARIQDLEKAKWYLNRYINTLSRSS